jgi:transcriptional regulator with XRE-family HTH domain
MGGVDMTSFGDRLQFLIKSNGITQKDLADTLNVKRGSVSNWVTNRRFPDAETLIKIADYFHVTIDFLLRGADEYLNKEYDEISSLYKKYSDLSEDDKELIDTMIQTMIKKRKDK